MRWIILALLAALVVVFLRRRDFPRASAPVMIVLAIAALVVAGFQLSGNSGKQAVRRKTAKISEAVGFRLGNVLAEEVPPGARVLVLHNGTAAYLERAKAELEGFLKGIRQSTASRGIEIIPYVPKLSPEEQMIFAADYLPVEALRHARQDHPDAQAYVSLIGAPLPDPRQWPDDLPPIYATAVSTPEIARPLLHRGIVRAMVYARPDPRPIHGDPARMTPEELFDARYVLERAPQ
jgi:hypothetical protein